MQGGTLLRRRHHDWVRSMADNVSVISMIYTLSAVAGPMVTGATIKASNGDALMWLTAAAASVMALLLVGQIPSMRPSANKEQR